LLQNQVSGSIPLDLNTLTSLKKLNLMDNKLSGTFPSFASNPLLQSLNLTANLIGGSIPVDWYNLTQLENLGLYFMPNATGNFSTLLGMTKLKNLIIGGPTDSAGDWGALPENIGALSLLEFLDTRNVLSHGTIPTTIGLLTNLSEFFR
jgi:Leucine-rich repeat (LRR) protein